MKDLIEALTIIQKCLRDPDTKWPLSCEHDILYVCDIDFNKVTLSMLYKLKELGFIPGSDDDGEIDLTDIDKETWNNMKGELTNCFRSYRFGSC